MRAFAWESSVKTLRLYSVIVQNNSEENLLATNSGSRSHQPPPAGAQRQVQSLSSRRETLQIVCNDVVRRVKCRAK